MTAALVIAIVRLAEAAQAEPVSFAVTHVEDAHPQIIRIYNLDDGPHAIVLPHAQSDDSSRPIRILNAVGEGVQEIAQPTK
jgi:hypothetical protein